MTVVWPALKVIENFHQKPEFKIASIKIGASNEYGCSVLAW